jgi:hypothetical protein
MELETVWSGTIDRQRIAAAQRTPAMVEREVQPNGQPQETRRSRILAVMEPVPSKLWVYADLAEAVGCEPPSVRRAVSEMQRLGDVRVIRVVNPAMNQPYARVMLARKGPSA